MNRGIALALCLLLAGIAAAQPKINFRKPGAPVPPFAIEQLNGRILTNAVLQKGKPALLVIFSPQCDHCALALDSLRTFGQPLSHTQVVLVTEARNKPYLRNFLSAHGYDKVPQFKNAGFDKGNLIFNIYNYGLLPQFNVYNARHQLVKSFTGIFPMDSLKMFLPR